MKLYKPKKITLNRRNKRNQNSVCDGITNKRKWKAIDEKERYNIELLLKQGYKVKDIAQALNRDRRTIERELKRGMVTKKTENPHCQSQS